MPWEKSFDIDVSIDRAMNVFMVKGYEATSLNDLMSAIGIQKGSFYNAFGSKKKLFCQCLLKYDREQHRATLGELKKIEDPVVAISTLFDKMITQSIADKDHKGCLLINTALDLPNQDADIVKAVKKSLSVIETFFKDQIKLGHQTGSIPKSKDPTVTAKGLMALVAGLRVLSRGAYSHSDLKAIKSQALNLIK